jgi:hypothetical protein
MSVTTGVDRKSNAINPLLKACHQCGLTDKNLSRCARCHLALYCSVGCQRAAWPTHKPVCVIQGKPTSVETSSTTQPTEKTQTIDEQLIQLFSSSSKTQKLMFINGEKVGILFSPNGNVEQKFGFKFNDKTLVISTAPLKKETIEQIKKHTPNQECPQISGKSFGEHPIFKAFGFE